MIEYSKEDYEDIIDIKNFIHKARLLGKAKELEDLAELKSRDIPNFGSPFTWYRSSYNEIVRSLKTKHTRFVTVEIEINVSDDKTDLDIEKALVKGIYYGLDVRKIAIPQEIKTVKFTHKK